MLEKSLDLHPPSPSSPISIDHTVRRLKTTDQSKLKDEYPRHGFTTCKLAATPGFAKIISMPLSTTRELALPVQEDFSPVDVARTKVSLLSFISDTQLLSDRFPVRLIRETNHCHSIPSFVNSVLYPADESDPGAIRIPISTLTGRSLGYSYATTGINHHRYDMIGWRPLGWMSRKCCFHKPILY
jgi:hypothetical protein